MESEVSKKIDRIFSITSDIKADVARIKTDVALIKQRDANTDKRLNSHEGKLNAIEEAVLSYKLERAKIMGGAIAISTVIGAVGSFLFWLFGIKH